MLSPPPESQLELLHPLKSDSQVIVYLDIKSPYAYLAIEPTRELERQLGVKFDWRPFVLDIPSYLGSAQLDESGQVVEQDRSAQQWAGVKYAYRDCRRYARLINKTIRGTEKIWNTDLVAIAMLWARAQGHQLLQNLLDLAFSPFWVRELDIDDITVIERLLEQAGADTAGFPEWALAEGATMNSNFQKNAFDAGVYGVPSYVVGDEIYFGREHLPQIKWRLNKSELPAPDIAYTLPVAGAVLPSIEKKQITIGVDESLDSLLAIGLIVDLLEQHELSATWLKVASAEPEILPPLNDRSRGAIHKHCRSQNQEANLRRYAPKGVVANELAAAIGHALIEHGIELASEGPNEIIHAALPGIVIKLDEELFIGRQHLTMVRALLALPEKGH